MLHQEARGEKSKTKKSAGTRRWTKKFSREGDFHAAPCRFDFRPAHIFLPARRSCPRLCRPSPFSPLPRSRSSFWAPRRRRALPRIVFSRTHAERLHLLKAIHYDSKIISFDSSRRRRGRHPIKSYVAAPETSSRIQGACSHISRLRRAFSFPPFVPRRLFPRVRPRIPVNVNEPFQTTRARNPFAFFQTPREPNLLAEDVKLRGSVLGNREDTHGDRGIDAYTGFLLIR